MKEITVKRVAPEQLPKRTEDWLGFKFKVGIKEFIAIYDDLTRTLFVNERVPVEDVGAFVKYVTYPGAYICDTEAEGGLLELGDYIAAKYGESTWECLFDAYKSRQEVKNRETAMKAANKIIPLIKAVIADDDKSVSYDGYLASSMVSCGGYKYLFWLGYLAGTGQLQEEP